MTRTHGALGVRLTAHDLAGTVRLTTDVRGRDVAFNFAPTSSRPALPAIALPGMRILHARRPPNTLSATVYDDQHRGEPSNIVIDKFAGPTLPDEILAFVEDLAVIQDRLRRPFPLPGTIRGSDLRWADQLRRPLEGETVPWVHGTLTATLDPDKLTGFKAQFPAGGGGLRVGWDDQIVSIGGVDVHTGPMYMTGIVTIDLDAIPDLPTPGQDVTTTFHLVDEQRFQARLGMPDEQPQTDPTTPPRGRVSYNPTFFAGAEAARPAGPETEA